MYSADLPSAIEKRRKDLRAHYLDGVVFGKPRTSNRHVEIDVRATEGVEWVNSVRLDKDPHYSRWTVYRRNPDCICGQYLPGRECKVKGQRWTHEWESVWVGDELSTAKVIAARTLKGLPEHNENLRTRYHTLTPACAKGRIHEGDCE